MPRRMEDRAKEGGKLCLGGWRIVPKGYRMVSKRMEDGGKNMY